MKNIFLLLTVMVLSIFTTKAVALNVTYLSPTLNITNYWHNTYAAARSAAKDLGINLTIIEGQGHHIFQAQVLTDITRPPNKPDLLIFHTYPQTLRKNFDLLEQKKIPFITYSKLIDNHELPESEQHGRPQEKYKYWLSEHSVDNTQGASLLVNNLLKQAYTAQQNKVKNNNSNNKLKVLAFSGDFILESHQRSLAVAATVKENDNAMLVQDIVANWSAEEAEHKFKALYTRHKGIDVVWASSDVMALGALSGALTLGLKPNEDIFIGGFDWDKEAIDKIRQKQLSASAGGQIYNIAWLLVRAYDHFNNQSKFNSEDLSISDKYTIIEQENLDQLVSLTDINNLASVNFYCFTKTYSQKKEYDFSMAALLEQLNNTSKHSCI